MGCDLTREDGGDTDSTRGLHDLLRAFEEPGSLDTFVEMVSAR